MGSSVFLLVSMAMVTALLREGALRLRRSRPASGRDALSPPIHSPYASSAADVMYDLLFCDRWDSFHTAEGKPPAPWQGVLFSAPPDVPDLKRLAGDPSGEGRIRYLAFARLREAGVQVEPKVLLGVIIEVGLEGGLDALAT